MSVADKKETRAPKPSRTASAWSKLTAAHRARLKELFSHGAWHVAKVRDTIHQETGVRIIGPATLKNIFLTLTGYNIGGQSPQSHLYQLTIEQREQVKARWIEEPLISYPEMRQWIRDTFGIEVTARAVMLFWRAEVAPSVLPPLPASAPSTTAEITLVIREGEKVTGRSSIKLPFRKVGE